MKFGKRVIRYYFDARLANRPHMPIGKVWIYRLLFVCFFVCLLTLFVRLRISAPMIKLAGNLPFWELCFPQKPKIGRIGQRVKNDKCSSS